MMSLINGATFDDHVPSDRPPLSYSDRYSPLYTSLNRRRTNSLRTPSDSHLFNLHVRRPVRGHAHNTRCCKPALPPFICAAPDSLFIAMSLAPVEMGPGRRRHKSSSLQDEPLHTTLGQSFNAGDLPRPFRHHQTSSQDGLAIGALAETGSLEPFPAPQFVSKLPTAVATVPQEDARSYVHSKRVTNYLVGSTLGEGSFAKVKEGFHVLVGEKVRERERGCSNSKVPVCFEFYHGSYTLCIKFK